MSDDIRDPYLVVLAEVRVAEAELRSAIDEFVVKLLQLMAGEGVDEYLEFCVPCPYTRGRVALSRAKGLVHYEQMLPTWMGQDSGTYTHVSKLPRDMLPHVLEALRVLADRVNETRMAARLRECAEVVRADIAALRGVK